jgi:hypothetical protein
MALLLAPVGVAYLGYKYSQFCDSMKEVNTKILTWKDGIVEGMKEKWNKKEEENKKAKRQEVRDRCLSIKEKYFGNKGNPTNV